jgi:regulator of chromosome condensation
LSKEEYNHVSSASSTPGAFPRASGSSMASRKVVRGKRDKKEEYTRHVTALNKNFSSYIENLMRQDPYSSWDAAIQDYLGYVQELETRYLTTERKGQLFTFGSGDCGQLAHGVDDDKDMMVKNPRLVRALQDNKICRIACGGLHNAAISTNGQVFTWGCNDDGSLGRAGDENFPGIVTGIPKDEVIIQVVAGDVHSAALSLSGEVYVWGCYRDGDGKQWCHGKTPKESFKNKQENAEVLSGLPEIVEIKCGSGFTVGRCSDGTVYTWGLNVVGELGRKSCEMKNVETGVYDTEGVFREHLQPRQPVLSDGSAVRGIKVMGAGANHLMLAFGGRMTQNVYSAGLNNYGQLGVGDHVNRTEGLECVTGLEHKQILSMEGGIFHSMALTVEGEVFTWGRGDSGQLGTRSTLAEAGYCEES